MRKPYRIYCDESCHLEHDHQGVMVLGAIWCDARDIRLAMERIKDIKLKHGLPDAFDAKWTKVSPAGVGFYLDLIDYFFDTDMLNFRSVVIPEKSLLNHAEFNQDHDDWYFKMYFLLLRSIIRNDSSFEIFLDIKDTRSSEKIRILWEILANSHYDFSRDIVRKIQSVRSEEVQLIQLADLLIGAISYVHRKLESSSAKLEIVERIRQRSGLSLQRSTLPSEQKFNVFIWHPRSA